jgi:hypothetical protein
VIPNMAGECEACEERALAARLGRRRCDRCDHPFQLRRAWGRYCSTRCRVAAFRARRAAA